MLDMKESLQGVIAAMESVEDATRGGDLGLVGLQLIRSESTPESCESMGDNLGEDFDFDGNLTN